MDFCCNRIKRADIPIPSHQERGHLTATSPVKCAELVLRTSRKGRWLFKSPGKLYLLAPQLLVFNHTMPNKNDYPGVIPKELLTKNIINEVVQHLEAAFTSISLPTQHEGDIEEDFLIHFVHEVWPPGAGDPVSLWVEETFPYADPDYFTKVRGENYEANREAVRQVCNEAFRELESQVGWHLSNEEKSQRGLYECELKNSKYHYDRDPFPSYR